MTALNADVEFATTDMAIHCLWPVPQSFNERIAQAFGDMDALYVADGHHRIASSKLLNKQDGVMAFVLDESQLHVTSFHRIVSDDQDCTWIDLASPLKDAPQGLPESGIYAFHGGNWYHLTDEGIAFRKVNGCLTMFFILACKSLMKGMMPACATCQGIYPWIN